MSDILKTLPTYVAHGRIRQFLGNRCQWNRFYFTLGRGQPQRFLHAQSDERHRIYFVYAGRIVGSFPIEEIVKNEGQFPPLKTLEGETSSWQIAPDRWVAVCEPPFVWLRKRIFHEGFRGWRYFDLEAYSRTPESKVRL